MPFLAQRADSFITRWSGIRETLNPIVLSTPTRTSLAQSYKAAGDFAQGLRLMRISFAEVSRIFLGGTEYMEPPMMVLRLMYIMVMFRESSARDFQPVEAQLLRHLCGLTSASSSSSSSSYQGGSHGGSHPTANL
jgi:hypothetical protein